MAASKVSIKLFVDTKKNKVLFAEAGKQFVDFLFNLFALPVGTVISLITKKNMVGSLGNLYESVECLSATYIQPHVDKKTILNLSPYGHSSSLLLADGQYPRPKTLYCSSGYNHPYVSTYPKSICGSAGCDYTLSNPYPPSSDGPKVVPDWERCSGYVRGASTYMVMDDLAVKPMSTLSSITTMLEKFNITDVGLLEEKVVDITRVEGLKLLKESLLSETVLTNVFLCSSSA